MIYLGIVGMFFILLGFILDEFSKKLNQESWQNNSLQILGAGLLSYYAYFSAVWPFLILNLFWFIIALVKLIKIMTKKKRRK